MYMDIICFEIRTKRKKSVKMVPVSLMALPESHNFLYDVANSRQDFSVQLDRKFGEKFSLPTIN